MTHSESFVGEIAFQVGDLIENRYRVLSVIGSGGMGTLYRVSDEIKDDMIVGFKTIRLNIPDAEASEVVESFQNEFQILTQLFHPNLVSVYDFGSTTGGELYFTLEWIEGRHLDFNKPRHEVADSIPVIVQICRALAYLHARGVVHGDLKPSNILMCDEQAKIVDFGLAFQAASLKIRPHYCTPGYSAPEIRQQAALDHRIDLYSLGAVWYALLVGEPPIFISGADYLIRLALTEGLENQDGNGLEIIPVIERLLANDPMDRYGTADEVIEAINRVMGSGYALETRETAGSYALRGRFVGRKAELEGLKRLWRHAQKDGGKMVLVSGESGVGKTRLIEEFVVQAGLEGSRVARGQCVEGGGSAYRPWREVLRLLVRYMEEAPEFRLGMKRMGPVLGTLLPELWQRDDMAGLSPAVALEPQAEQRRLNEAIAWVLRLACGLRPTVVIIEDAQWADRATLELLQFLTRIPGQAGLLVCVTYRDDESDPAQALNAFSGDRVASIPMHRLSTAITNELVSSMLGLETLQASLTERFYQMTSGNAFFIKELIRSLAEDGVVLQRTVKGWHVDSAALETARLPDSIRKVVRRRLELLSDGARQALQWASIMGSVFWDGGVQKIGQVSKSQTQVALGEALEKELIFERDRSAFDKQREFLFSKPAVREVAYDNIPEEARRAYHSRAAAWLMAYSDDQISEHLGLIADQLEKAGRIEEAVTYLGRAGSSAAAQYANTEAVAYFSRALDLTSEENIAGRYELLLAREKVYDLQGSRVDQEKDLERLEKLAEILADDRRKAKVALRRASFADAVGDFATAVSATRAAIRLARSAGDVNGEAAGFFQSGKTLWGQGHCNAAQRQLKQGIVLARAERLRRLEANILLFIGTVSWYQGYYADAKCYCDRALDLDREMGDPVGEVWTLNMIGILYAYLGDYTTGRSYFEAALRITEEIGDQRAKGTLLDSLGLLLHRSGDAQAAYQCSRQALSITREIGDRRMEGYALTTLGHALDLLGRPAEAADAYQQSLLLRRELGQQNLAMESMAGLARISLAQGDLSQARIQVEAILTHLKAHTLDGIEERFRVYLTCYRVLSAGKDPRAKLILNTAHGLLQEHAARIEQKELRCSFLERVPAHYEIIREWESMGRA